MSICFFVLFSVSLSAGDGPELRDFVIRSGIVEPLITLIRHDTPVRGHPLLSIFFENQKLVVSGGGGGEGVERLFVSRKYQCTLIFLQRQRSPISVDLVVVMHMYTACRSHVHNKIIACMQPSRHPECIPTTVGPRYAVWARRIYVVAACWPSRMVVVREAHTVWKSAHTLCNVCAGFHVMYMCYSN